MKPCIEPGCLLLTSRTRCPGHEAARQRARNADPKRRAYKDPAYVAARPTTPCACCGATTNLTRHHVLPLAAVQDGIPLIAQGTLVSMCLSCNSSIGARIMADSKCPKHGGVVVP